MSYRSNNKSSQFCPENLNFPCKFPRSTFLMVFFPFNDIEQKSFMFYFCFQQTQLAIATTWGTQNRGVQSSEVRSDVDVGQVFWCLYKINGVSKMAHRILSFFLTKRSKQDEIFSRYFLSKFAIHFQFFCTANETHFKVFSCFVATFFFFAPIG